MSRQKILLVDDMHEVFVQKLSPFFHITDGTGWEREKVLKEAGDFEGVTLRSRVLIDREFIDNATNLWFIARAGAGMESIDLSYASSKGISCLSSP